MIIKNTALTAIQLSQPIEMKVFTKPLPTGIEIKHIQTDTEALFREKRKEEKRK